MNVFVSILRFVVFIVATLICGAGAEKIFVHLKREKTRIQTKSSKNMT